MSNKEEDLKEVARVYRESYDFAGDHLKSVAHAIARAYNGWSLEHVTNNYTVIYEGDLILVMRMGRTFFYRKEPY